MFVISLEQRNSLIRILCRVLFGSPGDDRLKTYWDFSEGHLIRDDDDSSFEYWVLGEVQGIMNGDRGDKDLKSVKRRIRLFLLEVMGKVQVMLLSMEIQ